MKKAFVFDFDDTLAVTDCRVYVTDHDGNVLNYLTPSEFNVYKLDHYESFDFSEFRDEDFVHNANPTFLIHLAKEVYNEGHKVFILTARDSSVAEAIQTWLAKFGIKSQDVHCVGGTRNEIAKRKKEVLLDIVANHNRTYFYDDSKENVEVFNHESLRSYHIDTDSLPEATQ